MTLPRKSLLNALGWSAAGQIFAVFIRLAGIVVLARLLTPHDYGVFSLALLSINLSADLVRGGFSRALIQLKDVAPAHISASFCASITMALILALATAGASSGLAGFFDAPQLAQAIPAIAIVIFLEGASSTSRALLQRRTQFRFQSLVDSVSLVLGNYLISISLAYMGFGYWSLVAGQVGNALLALILLYSRVRHPIAAGFSLAAFGEVFKFSGSFMLSIVANYFARSGDNIVVGKVLGVSEVGVYGRAFNLFSIPVNTLGQAASTALFPDLARKREDLASLRATYLRALSVSAALMMPAGVMLSLCAQSMVVSVLGDEWVAVGLPLAILGVSLFPRFAYKVTESVAVASGAVLKSAVRQIVYCMLVLAGAFVGARLGIAGVAAGVSFAIVIFYFLSARLANQVSGASWSEFVRAHASGFWLSCLLAAAGLPLSFAMRELSPWLQFIGLTGAGTLAAGAAILVSPRLFLGMEMLKVLQRLPGRVRRRLPRSFTIKLQD
ncbi:lipopolysaccharide biosynthesis protein [Caulobacter sp. NIBR2454]|uniref:lipopolysaccharide biosynthesis protein n=1 Tax=Caulobacter sp. NIBR2454 TaxID=3015996 RepID=UPI0022B6620E|nr:lipopolysaccharide biosynthesis protein [Caulobacter sp. NIBR2454]